MTAFSERPGIRVLRPLARDAHLETLLVRLEGDEPRTAVLARALDETGARARRVELVALERGRGAAVVGLLDVTDDHVAPALVLQHLAGPRLSEAIASREAWEAGETVAVLRPVVAALRRLHGVGAAHGAPTADRIVLTEAGPVLTELTQAELFAAGAPEVVRDRIAGVARDRRAVRELAGQLLACVVGPRSQAAHELARAILVTPDAELLPALDAGLEELAAPIAVRHPAPTGVSAEHSRTVPAASEASGKASADPSRGALGVVPVLQALVARGRALLSGLPAMRRRLVVGGAAAVAAGAVLLAVVPDGGAEPREGSATPSSTTATIEPLDGSPIRPDADPRTADDPLAAVVLLIALRSGCLRELSLLCLEGVDQPGSAALAADRELVLALRSGREAQVVEVDPLDPRLIERLGDSVLVELGPETAPASLLLMRGEAGWRIRDWIAGADQMPS